jgi:hypothetical protein
MPEADPTAATAASLLLHMPPGVASVNAMDEPMQTLDGPAIEDTAGKEVTVMVVVATAVPQLLVTV